MSKAFIDVLGERHRQVSAEGWTPEHDDQHRRGELSTAAGWYALNANSHGWSDCGLVSDPTSSAHSLFAGPYSAYRWPWDSEWWKPTDPRRDLVKAAALILAEIERLDRVDAAAQPPVEPEETWSTDEELFRFDSLEELLDNRDDIEADGIVYRGTKVRFIGSSFIAGEVGVLLERMGESAWDEVGEFAGGYPDVSREGEELLQALLDAWADHYCHPGFGGVASVREYVITASDMEGRS